MSDLNLSPSESLNETVNANIAKWHEQNTEAPKEQAAEEEVVQIVEPKPLPEKEEVAKESSPKPEVKEEKPQEVKEEPEPEEEPEDSTEAPEVAATIKVDGKEIELTEEDLLKYAQKGYGSEERFQKASMLMKEATEKEEAAKIIYQSLQQDPIGTLVQCFGEAPVRQVLEQWLANKLQFEMLDPAEQKKITSQQEAQYWEQQAQAKKQTVQQAEQAQLVAAYEKSLEEHVNVAIKGRNLPASVQLKKRIYRDIENQLDAGVEEPSVDEAVERVWTEIISEHSQILEALPEDELKSKFGKTAEKLRKANVSQFKAKQKSPTSRRTLAKKESAPKHGSESDRKKKAAEEYLKNRVDLPIFYDDN